MAAAPQSLHDLHYPVVGSYSAVIVSDHLPQELKRYEPSRYPVVHRYMHSSDPLFSYGLYPGVLFSRHFWRESTRVSSSRLASWTLT
jgi:hypothetical protein